MKRGPRQTAQIAEPPQGGNASLKFVVLCCAEYAKLLNRNEPSSRKLIRSHVVGVTKIYENKITCNDERVKKNKNYHSNQSL